MTIGELKDLALPAQGRDETGWADTVKQWRRRFFPFFKFRCNPYSGFKR